MKEQILNKYGITQYGESLLLAMDEYAVEKVSYELNRLKKSKLSKHERNKISIND